MLAALRGPPTVGHCGQALPCSSPQTSAVPCPCLPHNAATNRRSWKSAQPSRSAGAQRRACRDVSVAALKPFERPSREKVDRRRKDDAPDLPLPSIHQQTLRQSFTVGGLGLHTAEYAHLRLRPALAGEGRYFVRVPDGTNSGLFRMEESLAEKEASGVPDEVETSPVEEDLRVLLFLEYLQLQEETEYDGTFEDFLERDTTGELAEQMGPEEMHPDDEAVIPRSDGDLATVSATVENVQGDGHELYTTLGSGDNMVQGAEHLLAALEMLGVENCRIEIEGGHEVPIIDGSAQGWCVEIQAAGVRRATGPEMSGEGFKLRRSPVVAEPLLVSGDDGAFVSFEGAVRGSGARGGGAHHRAAVVQLGRRRARRRQPPPLALAVRPQLRALHPLAAAAEGGGVREGRHQRLHRHRVRQPVVRPPESPLLRRRAQPPPHDGPCGGPGAAGHGRRRGRPHGAHHRLEGRPQAPPQVPARPRRRVPALGQGLRAQGCGCRPRGRNAALASPRSPHPQPAPAACLALLRRSSSCTMCSIYRLGCTSASHGAAMIGRPVRGYWMHFQDAIRRQAKCRTQAAAC